jgi:hypothetical protein
MRRAILAVALGGVLLTGTACNTDRATSATAAPPAASPSPSPLAEATGVVPDRSADTRAICGSLDKIFTDDLKAFHSQIGKMIAYKEAKLAPEATKAQKAASAELKKVGAKIEDLTAAALDPELREAGATSAAKFVKSAADKSFFSGIKTQKDYDRAIEDQLQEWFTPVTGYCALTLRSDPASAPAS